MLPIKQYLPNTSQFKKDKKSLLACLNKRVLPSAAFTQYDFNPYPLLLNPSLVFQIEEAHALLSKAITLIVSDFFNHQALQEIISLPDPVIELLAGSRDRPYQLGAIRPDFLFDNDYNIKVCEINARFPSNLFIFSEYLYAAMVAQYGSAQLHLSQQSIPSMAAMQAFFDQAQSIPILLGQEKSTEIYLLRDKLLQDNARASIHTVSMINSQEQAQYTQFILNLHQEELLNLSPKLFPNLCCQHYFNDLRTIFIVHDKRLLAILSDKSIMTCYMPDDEVTRLQKYIIPTYLVTEKIKSAMCVNPKAWVLKKFAGGKGEGMVVGKETSSVVFKQKLAHAELDYIAQPFIEQPLFNLVHDQADPLYLVGCILSFNHRLLGPGLFRASNKSIINALGGGASFFTPMY